MKVCVYIYVLAFYKVYILKSQIEYRVHFNFRECRKWVRATCRSLWPAQDCPSHYAAPTFSSCILKPQGPLLDTNPSEPVPLPSPPSFLCDPLVRWTTGSPQHKCPCHCSSLPWERPCLIYLFVSYLRAGFMWQILGKHLFVNLNFPMSISCPSLPSHKVPLLKSHIRGLLAILSNRGFSFPCRAGDGQCQVFPHS